MMRIRLDPGVHDVEEIKSQEMTRAFFVAGGVGHLHTADQDILLDPGLIVALMEGRKAGGIVTDQGLDLILVQPFKSRQPRKMETISEFLAIASPTAPP